ncbi:hypothetical protein [Pandoraea commovens]|uniref:Integrase n=1 Tax=Pandoraea commovens TaxID=2508289 RepID=A0ABY5QG26_9BURK|nr:hypothetical protein [Pandoraea commovens]UVA79559.1 hypothetical protein NTU39_00480 [Pandoraea commovens]
MDQELPKTFLVWFYRKLKAIRELRDVSRSRRLKRLRSSLLARRRDRIQHSFQKQDVDELVKRCGVIATIEQLLEPGPQPLCVTHFAGHRTQRPLPQLFVRYLSDEVLVRLPVSFGHHRFGQVIL